ncbi:MAG: AMP-binding protein [Streptosporangiales bacterium]|nr:AMP-binding protein [Streptosporangiales bacterium]
MYPGRHARTDPDRPAVIMAGSGQTVTYRELNERSIRLARVLRASGLRPGDHMAIIAENHPWYFEVFWAAMRSGLRLTAVNSHLNPDEAAYIVTDCEASVLIVSHHLGELADALRTRVPPQVRRLMFGGTSPGYESYEELVDAASPEPLDSEPRGAIMLYSSGTTGRPKGIKLPLPDVPVDHPDNRLAIAISGTYGFGPDTVYLSPAPIYHAAPLGYTAGTQTLGGTVVMMERFDAEDALRYIEKYKVTHSQWVPTMFIRMLRLPEETRNKYDLSSHRVAIHAAAPCPPEVKRAMIDWWGPIIREYYGSSEGAGTTNITSEEWLRKPGSVGRPAYGEVHICADDGSELPTGEIGKIYFDQGEVAFSYHNDPEKTAETRHPTRPTWATVGDVGYVDADGYVFLADRRVDMILSGGVNIYPREIEDCLIGHPSVADVAVFGVPNPDMGEEVKAVVQPAEGVTAGDTLADELIAYARERISRYKVPRSVDFSDQLPRTPTGKLQKRLLRQRYWDAAKA